MDLRPYQQAAVRSIFETWGLGTRSTLLVLPTGTGKTICFAHVAQEAVKTGGRVLILAHREELLNQAADKLHRATGLGCAVEKADQYAHDSWFNVVVGSVQTMMREKRRELHDFTHIIIDEAHHAISESYRKVIDHFPDAKILGVTATADRGDKRNLGEVFETLAFEYTLPKAIRDGYLAPIKAQTIPLKIELDGVKQTAGDFAANELGTALDPYLHDIAAHIKTICADRKTVIFLPLVATSQKMRDILRSNGIDAMEINGESKNRADVLEWFEHAPKGSVLCNAMLLTEGWDCPSVDCVVVLRPTKVRALYCQMIGRGTRLSPGKENLLLLDFLWHCDRHELVRPAHLVCDNPDISRRVAEIMAEESESGKQVDLFEAEAKAESKAQEEREEALRKQLAEMRTRKRQLVDPLQFEYSIDHQAKEYAPDSGDLRAMAPMSDAQKAALERAGIFPDEVTCAGHAARLLDTIAKRRAENMTTPKQIRCLERYGFKNVGEWKFEDAKKHIDRIAASGWRIPHGMDTNWKPEYVA